MKFGKSYIDALANPAFPEEWRKGAIEYKPFKKLINGVVAELQELGLSQSVLHELLEQEAKGKQTLKGDDAPAAAQTATSAAAAAAAAAASAAKTTTATTAEHPPPAAAGGPSSDLPRSSSSPGAGEGVNGSPPSTPGGSGKKGQPPPSAPPALRALFGSDYTTPSETVTVQDDTPETQGEGWLTGAGGRRARAAYELAGTSDHPISRIRVTIESPVTSDCDDDESGGGQSDKEGPIRPDEQVDGAGAGAGQALPSRLPSPVLDPLSRRSSLDGERPGRPSVVPADQPASLADTEAELVSEEKLDPSSEVDLKRLSLSPRWRSKPSKGHASTSSLGTLHSAGGGGGGHENKDGRRKRDQPKGRKVRRRQVLIPLLADAQFLNLFTQALVAVQSVQSLQRKEFIAATQRLTQAIGQATSPAGNNQQDLYAWREIFRLWIEAQIFESTREADAGELPTDESERRLNKFAEVLRSKGWLQGPTQTSRIDTTHTLPRTTSPSASSPGHRAHEASPHRRRSISIPASPTGPHTTEAEAHAQPHRHFPAPHNPFPLQRSPSPPRRQLSEQSTQALQDFMALHVTLLDVKKYQQVNLEAARKLLKKHDKRTALSAGTDLKQFMALASSSAQDQLSPDAPPNAQSEEELPRPPDPVAIANAIAHEQSEDSHRARLRLRRRKKALNVGGLPLVHLGGGVGGANGKTLPSSGSSTPPLSSNARTPPTAQTTTGSNSNNTLTVAQRPPLEALLPASPAASGAGPGGAGSGVGNQARDAEESLAHILFSLMSSQLLHILPALDEVECSICTDVAWRPIRLDCGHLFCMRCMVKLQKQGWHDCPLCRAPDAVVSADERNLDEAMGNVLKVWFPREVREKEKEDERDRRQEQKKELRSDDKCIIC